MGSNGTDARESNADHLRELVSDLGLKHQVVEEFVQTAIDAEREAEMELADLEQQIGRVFAVAR